MLCCNSNHVVIETTGSTLGDISMIRFSDCIGMVSQLRSFLLNSGLSKKVGDDVLGACVDTVSEAISVLEKTDRFLYSEIVKLSKQGDV